MTAKRYHKGTRTGRDTLASACYVNARKMPELDRNLDAFARRLREVKD